MTPKPTRMNGPTKHQSAFEEIVMGRRATQHFQSEPVPEEVIASALELASQAPSGYNIQPWRFIVVRDGKTRERLSEAAFGQKKVSEAPVVIVASAEHDAWQDEMDNILRTRAERTGDDPSAVEKAKRSALKFIDTLPREVWLNRHVMIGFTYLMLAFESLGWDTAPMEGFDPDKVRKVVGLPDDAAVVALLAVGRQRGEDPPHPGRLDLETIGFEDAFGQPFAHQASVRK